MKRLAACWMLSLAAMAGAGEPVAQQFLRYTYGADVDLAKVSLPSDDLWMVRGAKNADALALVDRATFDDRKSGVVSGVVGRDLYFIELRDGLVDPAMSLDAVYFMHRQLVLQFIYAALGGDERMLKGLATDASKVEVIGSRASRGDMGQYAQIIQLMPVVRTSKPADDARTQSVTYRVPLGDQALAITLIKDGNTWKVDTAKTLRIPLEFFNRTH